MIGPVVLIVARLEQHAELHRLVGLVVVHGPLVQAGQPEPQRQQQRGAHHAAEDGLPGDGPKTCERRPDLAARTGSETVRHVSGVP